MTGMALGEHGLRVVLVHEAEDVPAACYVEVLTVSGAVTVELEDIAGRREFVCGEGNVCYCSSVGDTIFLWELQYH